MGTYNVPRDTGGEGKILFVFSGKALIMSVVGLGIGFLPYLIFKMIGMTLVGVIVMLFFALIGFGIGTFRMPNIPTIEFARKNQRRKD